ncbi:MULTISPECIES: DedA family protein [unclassified Nocardioides]|uniref:DedA family protein n=1 Tax=Nocardioides sp. URHA0032 TaxID=1380388 RepID=UPI001E3DF90F|nr:VTT domain-containing protein [Nocardioides sp. URHA0032]
MIPALVPAPLLLGMDWMDPNWLLDQFGGAFYWISLVILFIECGLFFPFLPGDTLLFALGLFLNSGRIDVFGTPPVVEVLIAFVLLTAAAFLGNVVGYEIGRAIGPPLYERNGRLLKKKYFDQTAAFFDRHGNKALVIGRFVPFVRTFITVVAGVTRMDRRRFFLWSAVGAVLWVGSILFAGFTLGHAFPSLGENIDKAILVILAFTVVPIAWELWQRRRHRSRRRADPKTSGEPTAAETTEV